MWTNLMCALLCVCGSGAFADAFAAGQAQSHAGRSTEAECPMAPACGSGNLVVAAGSVVQALSFPGLDVLWSTDVGLEVTDLLVVAEPGRSTVLAIAEQAGATQLLDGASGQLLCTAEGIAANHFAADIHRQLFTDPLRYPYGPPNLGGGPAADVIMRRPGVPATSYLMDIGQCQEVCDDWVFASLTWPFQFIADSNGSYDIVFGSEDADKIRMDGDDCATEIWTRSLQRRWGIPVPDVNGDGLHDLFAEPSYYSSTVHMLDGQTGQDVWTCSYGSFDVLGGAVVCDDQGQGVIVTAQGASAGGVRRYHTQPSEEGNCAEIIWDCDPTYDNNTLVGLLRRQVGSTIVSGWRHQDRAIGVDSGTGTVLWDAVPTDNADYVGIGVPDVTGDGNDDLLVRNAGQFRLYDGLSGQEQTWLAPLTGTAAAFNCSTGACLQNLDCDDGDPCTDDVCQDGRCVHTPRSLVLVGGDEDGAVSVVNLRTGGFIDATNVEQTAIADLDAVDLDQDGTTEILVTHLNAAGKPTTALDLSTLGVKWQTHGSEPCDGATSLRGLGHDLLGARLWYGDFDNDQVVEFVAPNDVEGAPIDYKVFSGADGSLECCLTDHDWWPLVYFDKGSAVWKLVGELAPSGFSHHLYKYTLGECPMPLDCANTSVNTWKMGAIGASLLDGLPRIWGGWYGRTLDVVDGQCNTLWSRSFGGSLEAEAVYAGDLRCDGTEAVVVAGTHSTYQIQVDAADLLDGTVLWTFADHQAHWTAHVMAIENVCGSCAKEVFIYTGGNPGLGIAPKYQALSGDDGTRLWEAVYPFDSRLVDLARLADVDGDGDQDILVIVDQAIEARDACSGELVRTYPFARNVLAFDVAEGSCPPQKDFAYRCIPVQQPGPNDQAASLPEGISVVAVGDAFSVEVWASDTGEENTGVVSAYADLDYAESAVQNEGIAIGGLFDLFPSGSDAGAYIDELGGSQVQAILGVQPQWVRLAVLDFAALAPQLQAEFTLMPASLESSALARGLIATDQIDYGAAHVQVGCPCTYDLDGNCTIAGGDLGILAGCWSCCEDQVCWLENACAVKDFDCNGCVAGGDLGWFAGSWLQPCVEVDALADIPGCRECAGPVVCSEARSASPTVTAAAAAAQKAAEHAPAALVELALRIKSPFDASGSNMFSTRTGQQILAAEIWARDTQADSTGLTAVFVDLHVDPDVYRILKVEPAGPFTLFAQPIIKPGTGTVRRAGGATLEAGHGAGQWVQVATAFLNAKKRSASPAIKLKPSAVEPIARRGTGLVPSAQIVVLENLD